MCLEALWYIFLACLEALYKVYFVFGFVVFIYGDLLNIYYVHFFIYSTYQFSTHVMVTRLSDRENCSSGEKLIYKANKQFGKHHEVIVTF